MLRKEDIKLKESEEEELRNQIIKEVYSFSDSPVVRDICEYGNTIVIEFERWIRFEDGTLIPHYDPVGLSGVKEAGQSECSKSDYTIINKILCPGSKAKKFRNSREKRR